MTNNTIIVVAKNFLLVLKNQTIHLLLKNYYLLFDDQKLVLSWQLMKL